MNQEEAGAKIKSTLDQQRTEDALGEKAILTALPGPMGDAFKWVPDITVGPYQVRRMVSRDFERLAAFGHPLNRLDAAQDADNFKPDGKDCWLFCWLMTRPVVEVKSKIKEIGVEAIRQIAEDEFGELTVLQLSQILVAIAKNLSLIDQSRVEMVAATPEGENSSPPPTSQA